MGNRYWRVIVKYGHVGKGNEVSVPRFLESNDNEDIVDVYKMAEQMPGVKNRGLYKIEEIDKERYVAGKHSENENYYLQKLMTFQIKNVYKRRKGSVAS